MRLVGLLLLVSIGVGCGNGMRASGSDPRAGFGTLTPSIMTLTPSSSPANSPVFTMTVGGSNLGADALVFWNGVPQQTTFVNSGQLLVLVNQTDLMFVGFAHIFVRTGGFNSNTLDFNVTSQ